MPSRPAVERALRHGLSYLRAQQLTDGGFLSYSSPTMQPFRSVQARRTIFVPALVLASLTTVGLPEVLPIRQRLADFLLQQKHPGGSFNYWVNTASEYRELPYPDDLDDTFCALSALYLQDPELITEQVLAQTVKLLLATEAAVGGPYRTWLVPPASDAVWRDTDIAVNANVAYFLRLTDTRLPNLDKLLDDSVAGRRFISAYYPAASPVIYYFARSYQGAQPDRLLASARRLHRQSSATAQDNVLGITSGLRLQEPQHLDRAIASLLDQQQTDGAWPAAAFCIDPAQHGQTQYNGSAALTTALACEALSLFDQRSVDTGRRSPAVSSRSAVLANQLLDMAKADCRNLSPEFQQAVIDRLGQLAHSTEGEEIMSLPQAFNDSLRQPIATMPDHFLPTLGLANLYGWLAYTIYDDFLDDAGRPALLPIANVALRKSVACFSSLLPFHRPFQTLIQQTFDTIDQANAWEVAHCRFRCIDGQLTLAALPDYGDLRPLAERSLGHGLPVLAVLLAAGVDDASDNFRAIQQALLHYLIARQLNDDLHDWEEDLTRGHITHALSRLLAGQPATGSLSLQSLISNLRKKFWYSGLPRFCREIRQQTTKARRSLNDTTILTGDTILSRLLDGIDASLDETLTKHRQARGFLQQYRATESS